MWSAFQEIQSIDPFFFVKKGKGILQQNKQQVFTPLVSRDLCLENKITTTSFLLSGHKNEYSLFISQSGREPIFVLIETLDSWNLARLLAVINKPPRWSPQEVYRIVLFCDINGYIKWDQQVKLDVSFTRRFATFIRYMIN